MLVEGEREGSDGKPQANGGSASLQSYHRLALALGKTWALDLTIQEIEETSVEKSLIGTRYSRYKLLAELITSE